MPLDLEAVKKKINSLNNRSSVPLWKPEQGEYKVRVLPWFENGLPFREVHYYYIGKERRKATLHQLGKPDPIHDFIVKLQKTGRPEDRELCKQLYPKMTTYALIIDRANEDAGWMLWSFNRNVYDRLLSFFTNEEIGDFTHQKEGYDLTVTLKPSGRVWQGKQTLDVVVDAARKPSVLTKDQAKEKKWLENMPQTSDIVTYPTYEELKELLERWMSPSEETTERAGSQVDSLDKVVADLAVTARAPAEKQKTVSDLDAALAELGGNSLKLI
jgi:hypothetical protein